MYTKIFAAYITKKILQLFFDTVNLFISHQYLALLKFISYAN